MPLSEPGREIMWNIGHPVMMYVLFVVALGFFCYGMWQRISYWRKGKPAGERWGDWGKRLVVLVRELILQRRTRQERFPGFFHSFIFYSFVALVVTTGVVALDYDFGTHFFKGFIYLFLSLAADIGGLLILVGVAMAIWRRYLKKPSFLKTDLGDTWALGIIGLLILTGFLAEGLRIALVGDKWWYVSPVGTIFSAAFAGIGESGGKSAHAVIWWTHTVLAMVWIATIPYTKFVHLLSIPTNMFFSRLTPHGTLKRVDLEAMMSAEDFNEETFNVGTQKPTDFTWKELMDFDTCISCGRCEDICPSAQANQPFSPKELVRALNELAHKSLAPNGKTNGKAAGEAAPAEAAEGGNGHVAPDIIGSAFDENFLWYCRTCMACMEVCPVMIEHVDTVINIRRNEAVMQGRMPADAARAMRLLETQGNPFGPEDTRQTWVDEQHLPVVGPGESVDVLYWIGCCTTFDPTKQKIATDLCKVLKRCGISFGVMGRDERCCGDPARLIGQEHLFQTIAKAQVADINARNFKVLLVSCPHCYNVLKNEYPQFGGNYNIVHHTEFLHEMLWNGTIKPVKGEKRKLVYHDPCYLGRYQKVYDSPREVIKAIPGVDVVEMKNHAEKSLCCGGGGGNYWFDSHEGERLNNRRVAQARDANADTVITGCAYCMQMLDDSIKIMDLDEKIRVMDIATLVLDSLGDAPKDTPTAS